MSTDCEHRPQDFDDDGRPDPSPGACPRCGLTLVWRHQSWQCPKCQYKEGCCG